jgi:hypothetical protein
LREDGTDLLFEELDLLGRGFGGTRGAHSKGAGEN